MMCMSPHRSLLFLLGCLSLVASALGAEKRTWKDKAGKSLIAEFVAVVGENVQLKRADGRMLNVPLSALSAEDQTWVKKQSESAPAGPATDKQQVAADRDAAKAAALKAAADKLAAQKAGKDFSKPAPPPATTAITQSKPLALEPAEHPGAILKPRALGIRLPYITSIVYASQRGPYVCLTGSVYDLRDDRLIGTVPTTKAISFTEALSSDGLLYARSEHMSGSVSVWDVASGKELSQLSLEGPKIYQNSSVPLRFAFTAARRLTWIGRANNEPTMISWDVAGATPKKLYRVTAYPNLNMVDIRSDGKYALLTDYGEMGIYDCATGAKLGILPVTRENIPQSGALSFSPDGTEVAWLGKTLKVIDLQGKVQFEAPTPEGHVLREDAQPLQYTPDGRGILVGNQKLIDRRSAKLVWDFDPLFRGQSSAYVVNDQQICTPMFDRRAGLITVAIPWAEIDTALKNGTGLPLKATTKKK